MNSRLQTYGLVAILGAALVTPLWAGPPLICPPTVLSEEERANCARAATGEGAAAVANYVDYLNSLASPRQHVEAVRYFYHHNQQDIGAFVQGLASNVERLAKAESPATAQARFDLSLARIMDDFSNAKALVWANDMAKVADQLADPALWLTTAEAIDLVNEVGGRRAPRHLLSQLSRSYFQKAIASASGAAGQEDPLSRKLVVQHASFMRGMHSRDWDWSDLSPAIERLRKTMK